MRPELVDGTRDARVSEAGVPVEPDATGAGDSPAHVRAQRLERTVSPVSEGCGQVESLLRTHVIGRRKTMAENARQATGQVPRARTSPRRLPEKLTREVGKGTR
jgi:hypothetical protein